MKLKQVRKVTIEIGEITLDAFTADELDENGNYINYLSANSLAKSIGLSHSLLLEKYMPADLKAFLGDFKTTEGEFKIKGGTPSKVTLWDTGAAYKFYLHYFSKGNPIATRVCKSLGPVSLDMLINDECFREYKNGKFKKLVKNKWMETREDGTESRKEMTDSIKHYIEITPGLKPGYVEFIYARVTNRIYMGIFGKTAKELRLERDCEKHEELRNKMSRKELELLKLVEERVAYLVDNGTEPMQAAYEALDYFNWMIVKYKKSLLAR